MLENKTNIRKDFDLIRAAVPDFKIFTFGEFFELRLGAASRAFSFEVGGRSTRGFVPFADMMNHSNTH